MSLSSQLNEKRESSAQNLPADIHAVMQNATNAISESDLVANAPKKGDRLAEFTLTNQTGEPRRLSELHKNGPLIVTFYRGGWCPYCNLELQAYQTQLEKISAVGATLVAITPELPDASMSTVEKNELGFEVLSDTNSNYAREIGIVFSLPEELRVIYKNFGIELEQHNGEGQFDLPLAATFLVNANGIIESAYVNADYTYRKEPSELVAELAALTTD